MPDSKSAPSDTITRRKRTDSFSVLSPNGHLGFAPIKTGSFYNGVHAKPDAIACDSGSCDIGPVPLACDISSSPYEWQYHDIEHILLAARKLGIPAIIGSAGDTGTNSQVDKFVAIVHEIAEKHGLAPFRLGYFYSEVTTDFVRTHLAHGGVIEGLDGRPNLTLADVDATDRIVAVAGVHPYVELLRQGCDVIIGGRSSDSALFAAPALVRGYSEDLAYFFGKVLECSSFCAEPYAGKETVLGEISHEDILVYPMLEAQRCTISSVAGHAMYERSNPFEEYYAGGRLEMRDCKYEQYDERTVRVTGSRFIPADDLRVKLEGAGKVGERFVGLVAIRDPYTISRIDEVIAWSRNHVTEAFGKTGYEVYYSVFGKNGLMGEWEPVRTNPHEICITVQGVAPTAVMAESVCMTAMRQLFYARLPDVKGTAGGVAFPFDEVWQTKPACRWTMNHTIGVKDPMELFTLHTSTVGQEIEEIAQ